MKLYLVRHARSERNAKIKSEIDSSLTSEGKEQAKRLGIWFNKIKINKIYCSKLKRARETLNEMKKEFDNSPIEYTQEINEFNMGIYQEKGIDDWKSFIKDIKKAKSSFYEFKPKRGESFLELRERARKFYNELLKKHSKDSILVVSHGLFLSQLISIILELDISEGRYFELSNAGVSQFLIKRGKVKSFHVNDYHHLLLGGIKEKPKVLLKKI